jgi:hypothetical protein
MAADFDEEYHRARVHQMETDTERLDLTFKGEFIDRVWRAAKKSANSTRVGRSDSFAGYIISVLQSTLDEPVQYAHQLVTVSCLAYFHQACITGSIPFMLGLFSYAVAKWESIGRLYVYPTRQPTMLI